MYITKSLFVDYHKLPKLARWKVHDKEAYQKIRKIDTKEQQEHIMAIGSQVEDKVLEFLENRHNTKAIDLMDIQPQEGEDDEDYYLRSEIFDPHAMMERTLQAMRDSKVLLYQPTFVIDNCIVRADMMIRQSDASYALCEVKAKTSVRGSITDDGVKKPWGKIKPDLIVDMSFQKYVINRVLDLHQMPLISRVELRHLDPTYIKNGPLDLRALLSSTQADITQEINIIQRGKETTRTINDTLIDSETIAAKVVEMKENLHLSLDEFEKRSPWSGTKFLEYFGQNKTDVYGTVMGSGIHHSNASLIADFYYQGRHQMDELTPEEVDLFNAGGQDFIELYKQAKTGPMIDHGPLAQELNKIGYPICFYDYESVSVPVPTMDQTSPYQQVVVQYSLHKLYEDGTIQHYGGLFVGEGERSVEQVTLPEHLYEVSFESEKIVTGHYSDLLREFLVDIGDDLLSATFVVWSKTFENSRNKEIANIFPDLQDYLRINEQTYDLRDIFSKKYYFDNAFKGSSSIKKVLPALVPDMIYGDILEEVTNGAIAMQKLQQLIDGDINNRKDMIEKLLRYCGLDSLAMVRIYEELEKIQQT